MGLAYFHLVLASIQMGFWQGPSAGFMLASLLLACGYFIKEVFGERNPTH